MSNLLPHWQLIHGLGIVLSIVLFCLRRPMLAVACGSFASSLYVADFCLKAAGGAELVRDDYLGLFIGLLYFALSALSVRQQRQLNELKKKKAELQARALS